MTDLLQRAGSAGNGPRNNERSTWGARLFFGTLFVVLVFFWWLLIYSGGVTGHHG